MFKCILTSLLACLLIPSSFADSGPLAEGRAIYQQGTTAKGGQLSVISQGAELPANLFACVNCHRGSGLGTSEGGYLVPAINGPTLFKPIEVKQRELYAERTEGFYTRPAYTRSTLKRAITEGVSSTGAPLSRVMPRYQLTDSQSEQLIDYLNTLDYSNPPGLNEDQIQIATIITDQTEPGKKQALVQTLTQYFKEKNAQTRHETRRVKYSPWHKDWHYDHYRNWNLNVWELTGDESTWQQQLQRLYEANPVFTVVGGTSHASWAPMHQFCENNKVPCLFPDTDLPQTELENNYTLYLSSGMSLEVNRVLQFLSENKKFTQVIQLTDNSLRGKEAAQLLAQKAPSELSVITQSFAEFYTSSPSRNDENSASKVIILWLENDELSLWPADLIELPADTVILSSTLLEEEFNTIPKHLRSISWLIHPYSLPNTPGRLVRSQTWLYARGIETPYTRLQSNTYLAVSVLIEALMHIRSNFSRNYMIERIEHMLENSPATSVYPRISLAPGQRYAAKGSYLLPLSALENSAQDNLKFWDVPEQ